jgi:hypothetical protein
MSLEESSHVRALTGFALAIGDVIDRTDSDLPDLINKYECEQLLCLSEAADIIERHRNQ